MCHKHSYNKRCGIYYIGFHKGQIITNSKLFSCFAFTSLCETRIKHGKNKLRGKL